MIPLSISSALWLLPVAFVSLLVVPPLLDLVWGARKLRHIPTVGHDFPVLSYLSALSYIRNGRAIIQEGYDKYKKHGGVFKMPTLNGWMVVLTRGELIDELRRSSDDELNANEAHSKVLAVDYTFAPIIHHVPHHVPLIRVELTRAVAALVPEMRDELVLATSDAFAAAPVVAGPIGGPDEKGLEGEWRALPALESIAQIVCRSSNRAFVGLPFCRDPDYCRLNKGYAMSVLIVSQVLNSLPYWLKGVAGPVSRAIFPYAAARAGLKKLEPTFKALLAGELQTSGMLQWLVDAMREDPNMARDCTPHTLMLYILSINFASVHTTTVTFVNALYVLAAHPEWADELRREIEQVLQDEGELTKAALNKMKRTDSFFREMSRLFPLGNIVMQRLAMRPMRFRAAEDLTVPADTSVVGALLPRHLDPEVYERPREFDPWRFVGERYAGEGEGEDVAKTRGYLFVNTSVEFLQFGHGKHACPGRFFAAVGMKSLLAHILTEYDVRLEGTYEPSEMTFGLRVPPPMCVGPSITPNRSARVLLRKRAKA